MCDVCSHFCYPYAMLETPLTFDTDELKGISNAYSLYSWVQIGHNMILSSLKDLTWNDKDDLSATYSTLCAWALAEISRNIRAFKRQGMQPPSPMIEWVSGKEFCNLNFNVQNCEIRQKLHLDKTKWQTVHPQTWYLTIG